MAIQRSLPSINSDSSSATNPSRTGPYLEAYTLPMGGGDYFFGDEGSFFVATNATLATGIAGHAAPVVADTDTKALLHLYNSSSTKSIIPVYLFLEVTAAGSAGTLHYTAIYIDSKDSTARSSGGTAITPVCTKAGGGSSAAEIYFGPVVTAMTSSKKVGQQIVREVIPVVQDTVLMKFGGSSMGPTAAITTAGTATNHKVQQFAPIVVTPGGNLNIAQIRPSQSGAASYQFEFGFIER